MCRPSPPSPGGPRISGCPPASTAADSRPRTAPGRAVGLTAHDLVHESQETVNAGRLLAPSKDTCPADVPGGEVGPRARTLVLVLDAHDTAGSGRQGSVYALARLDARLLVGRENAVGGPEAPTFPEPRVEIEHTSRLPFEIRVAREDPSAMRPGPSRIFREPAPDRGIAVRGDEPALYGFTLDLGDAPPRRGNAGFVRQLASQRLNGDGHAGGKTGQAARREDALRALPVVSRRTACATC